MLRISWCRRTSQGKRIEAGAAGGQGCIVLLMPPTGGAFPTEPRLHMPRQKNTVPILSPPAPEPAPVNRPTLRPMTLSDWHFQTPNRGASAVEPPNPHLCLGRGRHGADCRVSLLLLQPLKGGGSSPAILFTDPAPPSTPSSVSPPSPSKPKYRLPPRACIAFRWPRRCLSTATGVVLLCRLNRG